MSQQPNLSNLSIGIDLYKLARYVNVVIRNSQKIDQIKAQLYNQQFSITQLYSQLDFFNKGYIDSNDIIRMIQANGADKNAIQIQKIMRYFGATNNRITKNHLLKAVALPSWKMLTNNTKNQQKYDKIFFKFLVCIYISIEEDDAQRAKLKNFDLQAAFNQISNKSQYIRIDQVSELLVNQKLPKPDPFGLLRFMHNRIKVNYEQFVNLFRNNLPQKFQQIQKIQIMSEKIIDNKYHKKQSNDSEVTSQTNTERRIETDRSFKMDMTKKSFITSSDSSGFFQSAGDLKFNSNRRAKN